MASPSVYGAIAAIIGELAQTGISKSRLNTIDDYRYRSIDDITGALAPLLAKYRLCVLPRVSKRFVSQTERQEGGERVRVTLRVLFDLVSADDGSAHRIETLGEALDDGDKATAKAMTSAYKSAMVQLFCIPAGPSEEADAVGGARTSYEIGSPVQGWDQWFVDISDILASCETVQAVGLVQSRHRGLMWALNRERPDLYSELGCVFARRREALNGGPQSPAPRRRCSPSQNKTIRRKQSHEASNG